MLSVPTGPAHWGVGSQGFRWRTARQTENYQHQGRAGNCWLCGRNRCSSSLFSTEKSRQAPPSVHACVYIPLFRVSCIPEIVINNACSAPVRVYRQKCINSIIFLFALTSHYSSHCVQARWWTSLMRTSTPNSSRLWTRIQGSTQKTSFVSPSC